MSTSFESRLRLDHAYGFFDARTTAPLSHEPKLISNSRSNTMLEAIRSELARADSFIFSVAFITTDALAALKQVVLDFRGHGTIITSTYLGFNEPAMFRELLTLDNVDVYIYPEELPGFHAKGYVFEQPSCTTAIIGSSNLTVRALASNKEWNVRFSALPDGDIVAQLRNAIDAQQSAARPLDEGWIRRYQQRYDRAQIVRRRLGEADATFVEYGGESTDDVSKVTSPDSAPEPRRFIVENSMQREALSAIAQLREAGESKAVVISATGTGKTILGALDVQAAAPRRLLFVVHREQILDAAMATFREVLGAPDSEFGKFVGARQDLHARYLFGTVQSLSRPENLQRIDPGQFDYVLIDEVHRAGAAGYRAVLSRLRPQFVLGLTATPERTDGFNIFELFDYNVPYEIRLQAALEADMLCPFHYYGVTDYVDESGETITDTSSLARLASAERVDHVVEMLQRYGHADGARGLIFCSRAAEATALAELLSGRLVFGKQLRVRALLGSDPMPLREQVVAELERGDIDYIVTVDIFNEGIDIPALNQIVMLRPTQSNIIFTQQLGRGLRKCAGKDHTRVLDFIGNYQNNYLVLTSLLGNHSLNKEQIRQQLIQSDTAGSIAGLSSINFDRVSRARVLESLQQTKLNSMANLKASFLALKARLGGDPRLLDFARFDAADPVVVATKRRNYWQLLCSFDKTKPAPEPLQDAALNFLCGELLDGKRPHELLLVEHLLTHGTISMAEYQALLVSKGCATDQRTLSSVARVMSLEFFTTVERERYTPFVVFDGSNYSINPSIAALLPRDAHFAHHVDDVIATGLYLARHRYRWDGGALQRGAQYTRKDVCRLLGWASNQTGTVFGYKVDKATSTVPIFVTYHKADDITESTQYEDRFLDPSTMRWFTRSRRTLESPEVRDILSGDFTLHVFVKKDDAEGIGFNYLGTATPHHPRQESMPQGNTSLDVVTMDLALETPLDEGFYRYLHTTAAS